MDIFPATNFWDHTLIVYTWTQLGDAQLENHKRKYGGGFLKAIKDDNE